MKYAVVSIEVDVPFDSKINHLMIPTPLILLVAERALIGHPLEKSLPQYLKSLECWIYMHHCQSL